MNKKILISLCAIAAVAAIAVGGTIAFFSDTETSTGNTFTAGSIDLKVDSNATYNGVAYPAGTWGQTAGLDIVNEKFFDFADVKPGDSGENTVSLHVVNNDAWICAYVTNLTNNDNGINEPESTVDSTDGIGNGELQDNILMTVWRDNGGNNPHNPANLCNNVLDSGESVYVSGVPIDSNTGGWLLGHVQGDRTTCLGVKWEIPTTVGNIIQTDSVTGDISFYVEQYRNNPNFVCPPQLPVEPKPITRVDRTQGGFGDGGWAGWSCPAGTTAVGGGIDSFTNPVGVHGVAALGAPAVGIYNYPIYPHYTFGAGETGYVVSDLLDGIGGNTISFHINCQTN